MRTTHAVAILAVTLSLAAQAAPLERTSARFFALPSLHFQETSDFSGLTPAQKLWTAAEFSPRAMQLPFAALPEEPAARATTVFGLPRNMGPWDRAIRAGVGAALVAVGSYGLASKNIPNAGSGAMIGVSLIPFVTAITGYCPLYQALGIDYSF